MKSSSRRVILQNIIVSLIFNLPLILTNISTGGVGGDQVITSSDAVGIKNISLSNSNEKQESLTDQIDIVSNVLEPSVDLELNIDVVKDSSEKNKQPVSNILTENSAVSNEILNNDTPAIVTFSERSTVEFEKLVGSSLVSPSQSEENRTRSVPVKDEKVLDNFTKDTTDPTPDNISQIDPLMAEVPALPIIQKNVTTEKSEEIPSFSEWAQKRLEEVEKNEQVNSSSKGQGVNGKGSTAKLRSKNYASLDCGAKVIAANPEAVSAGAILSPSSDEYKLNTCTSRIWFVVELCEAIQVKKIDLANYELFSSSPKDFTVSVSDRYPTRDWSVVGKFTAKDERDIQSFDLDTQIFGKYIKVEIKSHYGSEHYCPISLFRAYGTSVFEVLQKEDPANVNRVEDDDDDDDDEDDRIASLDKESEDSQKNLFSSATDAVISIVKRAAEVLGNKVNNQTFQVKTNRTVQYSSLTDSCSTPSYMIYCNNCSDSLFGEIYELISCKASYIKKLVGIPLIYKALLNSLTCRSFGYVFGTVLNSSSKTDFLTDYITSVFPFKHLSAMCNEVSILENTGVLNVSQQFSNTTENITNEKIINLKVPEPHISKSEPIITKLELPNGTQSDLPFLNTSESGSTASNLDAVISQIKPTKALTADVELSQTNADLTLDKSSEVAKSDEKITSGETDPMLSTENFSENTVEPVAEMEVGSEGIDVLDDHLDHLISEFNVENTPISPTSTTNTPQAQKESIFLRLSNRIKALERNMSLSSQYLEELSRRYKKQVEEMQNLLEKNIIALREEGIKKDLRNKQLEDRLDSLTAAMESLMAERHNSFLTVYWLIFSVLIIFGICFFCRKSSSGSDSTTDIKETVEVLRRKSIDVVTHNAPAKKRRRPSDQALKIVRCSMFNNEEEKCKPHQRQRKRKKKQIVRRSNSIGHIKDDKHGKYLDAESKSSTDWVENSHQGIEDIPFVLDESDHSTLEAYPLANDIVKIDSPTYMRSAFTFRFNRGSSQNHENGVDASDKPRSDESNKKRYSPNSGSDISNSIVEPIKKEKKGIKRLFKKVF